jgi:hypothetical protein
MGREREPDSEAVFDPAAEGPPEPPLVLFTVSALRLHLPRRLPPTPRPRPPIARAIAASVERRLDGAAARLGRIVESARALLGKLRDR